jgi:hypothetical protein
MRKHKARFGELVQTDTMHFDWFGQEGIRYALHGFQDDVTGDTVSFLCLQGYFDAFRVVLRSYGMPEALYVNRIGIYFVNTKKPETGRLRSS